MIEQLARALRRAGIETDAVQLAEILWVATHRTSDPARPEPVAKTVPGTGAPGPLADPAAWADGAPAEPPMYLVPPQPVAGETVEIQLPAPVALPERLRLGRALRALKRRHPAPRLREFDLDATIDLYGDTGLLVPLLRPGSERWFDVTLVVDAEPTMDVWAQTTAELAKLLAGHGAFRRVRRLRLIDDDGEPWLLTDSGQCRHPRRAVSADGRQLVMVVSDCVGPPWSGQALWAVLREWGRHAPVVLIQTLPRRLWESTALGPADVRVRAYRPGQTNSGLHATRPWWLTDEDDGDMLPVVALTEADLARWARMVMGSAAEPVPAVPATPAWTEPTALASEIAPAARVAAVKATVSVEAYQLAVCLAAVPIRLPVARIVQYAILGDRNPVHLAEVFASGLLQRLTPLGDQIPPDEVAYDFLPGVRAVLQSSLTGDRTLEIFRAVASYLERTIGANASFTALLTGETDGTEPDPQFLPFAEVGASLLDRLGLRIHAWGSPEAEARRLLELGKEPFHADRYPAAVAALMADFRMRKALNDTDGALHALATLHEQCERSPDVDEPTRLVVLVSLGATHYGQGNLIEALRIQQEAVRRFTELYGPDHHDTLQVRENAANTTSALGQHAEARQVLTEVYRTRRAKGGLTSRATLITLNNLVIAVGLCGEPKLALRLALGAYKMWHRAAGPDAPETQDCVENIANNFLRLGRIDEAVGTYSYIADRRRIVLGANHPQTIDAEENLVTASRSSYWPIYASRLRVQGPRHPDTLNTLDRLLRANIDDDPPTQVAEVVPSEEPLAFPVETARAVGGDHTDQLAELVALAVTFEEQEAVHGPDHPRALRAKIMLAHALAAADQLDGQIEGALVIAEDSRTGIEEAAARTTGVVQPADFEIAEMIHQWILTLKNAGEAY